MIRSAILLIAHGSRVDAANTDLKQLSLQLESRCPGEIVEPAFLELAEPTIPQGFQACIERGAGDVRLLPWFLSAGAHVTQDLEEFRRQFEEQYPNVRLRLCPPLGLHPLMIDILLDRLEQAE